MIKEEKASTLAPVSHLEPEDAEMEIKQERVSLLKDENIQIVRKSLVENDMSGRFSTSFEDFKKLMLACMWGKRLSKNEILMMNLIQNISLLNSAVQNEDIPLKKAIVILEGLSKVYSRKMAYLYDDSRFVLNQLDQPFKDLGTMFIKESMTAEEQHAVQRTKVKRRKEEEGIRGHQAQNMKLDLKNSKWWNVGFNTTILQDHLNQFLS
jgi:hypothetical protein